MARMVPVLLAASVVLGAAAFLMRHGALSDVTAFVQRKCTLLSRAKGGTRVRPEAGQAKRKVKRKGGSRARACGCAGQTSAYEEAHEEAALVSADPDCAGSSTVLAPDSPVSSTDGER